MGVSRLGMRGVQGRLFQRIEAVTAEGWQGQVGMLIPSDQSSEEYKWLGQTPGVREWIGGRHAKGFTENGLTVYNKTFEGTIEVNVDEIRRDKSAQLQARIDELGQRVGEHWHKLLSALIEANPVGYDASAFFADAHSEGDSGTQDNNFSDANLGVAAATTPSNPTADEMRTRIQAAIGKIIAFKDNVGEFHNANAKQFMVMVPPNMLFAAIAATQAGIILTGGASNDNVLAIQRVFNIGVTANPRLTSTTVFYVFRTDAMMKPFILQDELLETGEDDQSFTQNRILVGVKLSRNVAVAFWQYAGKITIT